MHIIMNERSFIIDLAMAEDRKDRISSQRRKQILDAAFVVFSRKGFAAATTHEIAREAGVAVGTIYNYFQNKRDILVKLVQDTVITAPFLQIIQNWGEVDDQTFIRSIVSNRVNFALDNVDTTLTLFSEILRDKELCRQVADEMLTPNLKLGRNFIQSKVESGAFRHIDADIAIRCMIGMIIGFIILRRIEGEQSPVEGMKREYLVEQIVESVLGAVKP